MILALLHQLDTMKTATRFPWRQLCAPLAYASVMRWRRRRRQGQPVCQTPGPKKTEPFNAAEFFPLLRALPAGVSRTHGAGELYARFAQALSRREFQALVQEQRQDQLHQMKRIHWLWAGLAWSCDATEYGPDGTPIVPVQDLASRYRFAPLVLDHLDGNRIAAHLERLFRQHGAPLFLKRDNGSPFNHHLVDEVLARFGVLPLNNPPHFPRYNGAMEKGIRDFKAALAQRPSAPLALAAELTAHELNHRPRRCLRRRTACAVFHDPTQRRRWSRRQRQYIFRLLLRHFGWTIGAMAKGNHHSPATAWRVTVEAWLRGQRSDLRPPKPKTKCVNQFFQKLVS
jgi:hypothetical protein